MSAEVIRPVANDRLPLQKRIALLADRGLWPQMEPLVQRHGASSPEVSAFIDAHLPKAACPICGTPFYDYSRRVKYCSDKCRRRAAEQSGGAGKPSAPTPAAPATVTPLPALGNRGVSLVRDNREARTDVYTLLLVTDLFGRVKLVRQWGRDGCEYRQQVQDAFRSLDEARVARDGHLRRLLAKGYRVAATERGKEARRAVPSA